MRYPPRSPRPLRPLILLACLLVSGALLLPAPPLAGVLPDPGDPCLAPGTDPEPLSLTALWALARERDAGFQAAAERLEASEAVARAVNRSRFPGLEVDGLWNYGQRTSPGEERVLGVGPRSDLRLLSTWSLLDGGRSARARGAGASRAAARAGAGAFALAWEAEVARSWSATRRSEAEARALEEHHEALESLLPVVERRVAAGVEGSWELRLLEETRARGAARRAQALEARDADRAELSALAGRCVTAATSPLGAGGFPALGPTPPGGAEALSSPAGNAPDPLSEHPALLQMERLAEARSAQARAQADQERWNLSLVGGAGPTRSRAFDPDPVEYEYLAGVAGQFRLDLAGVARQERQAGEAEARALRAEADRLREAHLREAATLDAELARMGERRSALERESLAAEATLEAARMRWAAGVDGWQQVMQALERRLAATLAHTAWEETFLLTLVRRAELEDRLAALATQLESVR
jgi:outer membrane protein TolC